MKLVRWKRFTWDLKQLPTPAPKLDERYIVRPAFADDHKAVSAILLSTFSLDSTWSDTGAYFREWLAAQIEIAFERESAPALVITHGQRIIAASAINTDIDAETHLVTGPCVSMEYHNRGLGTALLYHTLMQLRQSGLTTAYGISKDNVAVAKFVYPKFGAVSVDYEFDPAPARA
jgi:predicted N-acetyltransferase YhbS